MKKLILAVVFCMIAVPAMADTWTFDFEMTGDVDHIVMYHKVIADPEPAEQDFVDGGNFIGIELPAVSPQTFVVDYADGVRYGMYAVAYDANGDSAIVMGDDGSPLVWVATAIPEIMPARYIEVQPILVERMIRILETLLGQ
jgi:hypothetical protein